MLALRQFAGVLVLSLLSFGAVTAIVETGRGRLEAAQHAVEQVLANEATLLLRLQAIETNGIGDQIPAWVNWAGADRATIGLEMQRKLIDAATKADVALLSFGLGLSDGQLDGTVSYDLEAEGGHAEAGEFLRQIEAIEPPLAVSYLWARPLPLDPLVPKAPLNLRLTVWGFGAELRPSP